MRFSSACLAIFLAVLLLSVPVFATTVPSTGKGTQEAPYTLKDIPSEWIKRTVSKDDKNIINGYIITVPADRGTAYFKLSGTQFKEYRLKDSTTGKYGETIQFNEGKLRTIKDVTAVWVLLRKPIDKTKSGTSSGLPSGGKLYEGELKAGDKIGNITIVGDGEERKGSPRQG